MQQVEAENEQGNEPDVERNDLVKEKIVHILRIYPVISPTMLQSGLGAYIQPAIWRPALEELINEGVVVRSQESAQTPHGRHNTYEKLSLRETASE